MRIDRPAARTASRTERKGFVVDDRLHPGGYTIGIKLTSPSILQAFW
jgi:hypothetical protein